MKNKADMKPILFSTPMVQAILAGRKTMTRRIIKPQPSDGISYMKNPPLNWEQAYNEDWKPWKMETENGESIAIESPYQPGDVLYVRETHYCHKDDKSVIIFEDQNNDERFSHLWRKRPSIHMPKAAARIFLKVTAVRAERLCDISEADAIAEGVESWRNFLFQDTRYKDYEFPKTSECRSPISSFRSLWNVINGPESWDENPWVFAYTFERCERPNPQSEIVNPQSK